MGCGESKHAVATTESVSTRKNLSFSSSKKSENLEIQNDAKPVVTKISENANANSITSTSTAATNDEKPNSSTIDKIGQNRERKETCDNKGSNIITNLESSSLLKEEKNENKQIKVVESLVMVEEQKAKELSLEGAHERDSSRDSQSDYLSVNEGKSEYQSPPRQSIEERTLKEINDKRDDQIKQGDCESIQKDEQKLESGEFDNEEDVKEVKEHDASTEVETTPKAEMKDLLTAMDPSGDITKN